MREVRYNQSEVKIKRGEMLEVLPIKKRYRSIEEAAKDLGIPRRKIVMSMEGLGNVESMSFRRLTHIDLGEEEKRKKRRKQVLKQNNIIHEKH